MKFCVIALTLLGLAAADVSHLKLNGQAAGYSYSSSAATSSGGAPLVLPGSDSSSYQPEHLIPQHLRAGQAEASSSQIIVGGDSRSYQPEHLIPQHLKTGQAAASSSQIIVGADSRSYQPEHLIPQHLKAGQAAASSSQIIVGADSRSYQPAHLIPQHLKAASAAQTASVSLGAATQTADRNVRYNYIQSQPKALIATQPAAPQILPGSDSSSYTPAHLISQQQKTVQIETVPVSANTKTYNIGADTYTPEQYRDQPSVVIGANTYTPEKYRYQSSLNIGADTYTPEQYRDQSSVVIGANTYTPVQYRDQASLNIGANTYTPEKYRDTVAPAQIYQEPASNGIEEYNAEQQKPIAIGRDTVTPAHLRTSPTVVTSSAAAVSSNYGTQYGSNGGYVY